MALSLVCTQLVFDIFEPLVIWFVFGFVFVRELFGIWVCEGASTLICIIPNLIL